MDFPYLTKVAKLNIAALAAIASAPPPPEPKVEGAVSTNTTLSWAKVPLTSSYIVRWRRTDANQWQHSKIRKALPIEHTSEDAVLGYGVALKGVRVDDWVFGVSSVSKDGFE